MEEELDSEEDFNRVLVCNNSCWALGELAYINPDAMRKHTVEIINTLAEILGQDLISQLSLKNEEVLRHFAKTISITLGRLGQLDPEEAA